MTGQYRTISVAYPTGFEVMDWLIKYGPVIKDTGVVPFRRGDLWTATVEIEADHLGSLGIEDDGEPTTWC